MLKYARVPSALLGGLLVIALIGGVPGVATAAPAPTGVICNNANVCEVAAEAHGSAGGKGDSSGSGKSKDSGEGGSSGKGAGGGKPKECKDDEGKVLPCSTRDGAWSASDNCYWALQKPQDAPPPGKTASDGAWYVCTTRAPGADPLMMGGVQFTSPPEWRDTGQAPPEVVQISPGQAAAIVVKQMQFKPVAAGLSTDVFGPNQKWYVGMPLWIWVKNKGEQVTGPYSRTATAGGVQVTANAQLDGITYTMGDGGKVSCGNGGGSVYRESFGNKPSPSKCDYRYQKMSPGQGKGTYTVTAVSRWSVNWSAGGETGVIPMEVQSTRTVRVGEIQVLNVPTH